MKQTTHDIILSYMKLSGNSKQVGYPQLHEAMKLSWYKLFKKTKESIVRKWMPVVNGKVSYPSTAENILGVYTVDDCNELAPLYEDNFKNILPLPVEKCKCNACDNQNCLCPIIADNISNIDVVIYDTVYTNRISSRVLKNGDIVEERYEWIPSYNADSSFKEAVEVPSQKIICSLDLSPCGCPLDSQENIEKILKCGCGITNCTPFVRDRYPAIYNKFGYYKKDEVNRQINVFNTQGRKTRLKQTIVVYQSNGEDVLIPEYAKPALIALLNWTKIMYSPVYTYNDEIRAKRNFKREKNEMIKYLNPIPYELIVHGDNAITRSDTHANQYAYDNGCDYEPTVCATPITTVNEVRTTNTIIIQDGATDSVNVKVDGTAGNPVAGQITWQSNKLIGAVNVDLIIVNKNTEDEGDDFTLDNVTGILTRNTQWYTGDKLIIPLFKKTT